ncbi:hypothetical protein Tneu_0303 [Pyrobaculum neutrophilum V24Sta]|uniref:Uncharacterized protein n=1 Tax=Pyrobaculum neutrophilum (strain DSM 2338 / JCM 9278 / NBRC 100436 / V24Sta) TaxID=444157 RepID=B1YBC3_PYRNV|nr:hypothetical protein Tneu_0303 [Pyrobaculum neutrophilum V24Sta]
MRGASAEGSAGCLLGAAGSANGRPTRRRRRSAGALADLLSTNADDRLDGATWVSPVALLRLMDNAAPGLYPRRGSRLDAV